MPSRQQNRNKYIIEAAVQPTDLLRQGNNLHRSCVLLTSVMNLSRDWVPSRHIQKDIAMIAKTGVNVCVIC